jgi:hypothetical protein
MKTTNLVTISIGALVVLLLVAASLLVHPLLVMGAFVAIALVCGAVWLARHRAPSFRKAVAYANLGLGVLCLLLWGMNMLGWIGIGSTDGQAIAGITCLALGLMLLGEKKAG